MRPLGHAVTTLAFSTGTWAGTGSAAVASAVFVGGTLIDLDHYVDYLLLSGADDLSPSAFMDFYGAHRYRHIVLALHSWEILGAALLLLSRYPHPLALGLWAGCLFHMVLDVGFNGPRIRQPFAFYSLFYRARLRFAKERLLYPEDRAEGSSSDSVSSLNVVEPQG